MKNSNYWVIENQPIREDLWAKSPMDDTHACPHCRAGVTAIGPTTLSRRDDQKIDALPDFFSVLNRGLFLNAEWAAQCQLTHTAPVTDLDSKPLPVVEIRASATMPPMSSLTTGLSVDPWQCSCKRSGYFRHCYPNTTEMVPFQLVYDQWPQILGNIQILQTYECLGSGTIPVFGDPKDPPFPELLYHDSVVQKLKEYKIPNLRYNRVMIAEHADLHRQE